MILPTHVLPCFSKALLTLPLPLPADHGYVLAEMSVHQTRAFFKSKYGNLVDNPSIGKDLAEVYWKPGNSEMFLDREWRGGDDGERSS
jgi:hypothetical protein